MIHHLARAFAAGDAAGVVDAVTPEVTLRVAVHDAPFHGKPAVAGIIGAVLDGVLRDIEISETLGDEAASVVLFTSQVAEYPHRADGLLLARADESGRIADLTVFLRPLGALQALADEMGRRLGGPMPGSA